MVLVISFVAVLAFLVIPLAVRGARKQERPIRLLYFVAVGLGYILVEIAFIQRFVLFLGHPTYALTVVVFLLLFRAALAAWHRVNGWPRPNAHGVRWFSSWARLCFTYLFCRDS